MKRALIILGLLLLSCVLMAQISVYGRGSNMTGIAGIEAQIGPISIGESWRPLTRGESSYITTLNVFFREGVLSGMQPYISLSYSSKSFPYMDVYNMYCWDAAAVKYAPAISLMAGYKSVLHNRLSGRAAGGCIISDKGSHFTFEVGINVILF